MADRESHRRYVKSLGLLRDGIKTTEPDAGKRIDRVKAALAERDADELRRKRAVQQENAYASESLLASQEAQKHAPNYPEGKSIAEIYGIPSAGTNAYAFTEPEWNKNLREDLRSYLEGRHTQTCILTIDDAAKCALNIWKSKGKDQETFGSETLELMNDIHSNVSIGVGLVASAKVSKALGSLGVTVKQYFDAKGIERIIISSLWNDSKMHYAVVNGLNIKKNHPYPISNPTVRQLGVLAEDTVNGFKKGAVLSMIISAGINTNELVFNDDYHLVDWFGSIGSDFFKVMTVLAASTFVVSLTVGLSIGLPIVASALIWVGIDWSINKIWEHFQIEDAIVDGLRDATSG